MLNGPYYSNIFTSELTLVLLMTRILDLNFVDIVPCTKHLKMTIYKLIEGAPLKSDTSSECVAKWEAYNKGAAI